MPDPQRPRSRGECLNGPRPCPWVSCRHHLALHMSDKGRLQLHPSLDEEDPDLGEMLDTCSLDVADRGGTSYDEIGEHMGRTRQRAEQLTKRGVRRLRVLLDRDALAPIQTDAAAMPWDVLDRDGSNLNA